MLCCALIWSLSHRSDDPRLGSGWVMGKTADVEKELAIASVQRGRILIPASVILPSPPFFGQRLGEASFSLEESKSTTTRIVSYLASRPFILHSSDHVPAGTMMVTNRRPVRGRHQSKFKRIYANQVIIRSEKTYSIYDEEYIVSQII